MKTVEIIVVGAGSRGRGYSKYAEAFPEQAKIVGVAEPRDHYRQEMVEAYNIPAENVFKDWKELLDKPKFADAVIVSTQDNLHLEPAIALADKGYHMLLEKPMAPTEEQCRQIVEAAKRNDIFFAVCHVLRYTNYTQALKKILDEGTIGDIVSIQHLEPVGYWHQAHSYVRGNWRNEAMSSSMLLAKSCHDLDWLSYIMGCKCEKVTSFGSLYHFREENQPEGAADRCLDCSIESTCPYSAKKIYLGRVEKGETCWPVDVLTTDLTVEGVTEALRTGPYGRCVYKCDNDVVDHQVVNMEFAGGKTASFTMTAFNQSGHRKTRIFGTRGEINTDSSTIEITDFLTDEKKVIDTEAADGSILGGHGGGDFGLMKSFVEAVGQNDRSKIISGPDETLESHLMVFAAETARHSDQIVQVK